MRSPFLLLVLALVLSAVPTFGQGVAIIQIEKTFRAGALSGVVTLGTDDGIQGALVEECTRKWGRAISSTRTDESGHFVLPQTSHARIHYLRISLKNCNTLLVKVKSVAAAGPLKLRLEPST